MIRVFFLWNIIFFSSLGFSQEIKTATRSYRLGFSQNSFLGSGVDGASQSGQGVVGVYEFNLTPRFTIGIDLEYRAFAPKQEGRQTSQLGYGLLLKHSFPRGASEGLLPGEFTPYLEYGLLMNVTRIAEYPHAGTSHDTRLAGGGDFLIKDHPVFVDLSYHYSKLDYFTQPRVDLSYLQLSFGWRFYK